MTRVLFTLPDAEQRWRSVDFDSVVGAGPADWRAGVWRRQVPVRSWRLEYRFVARDARGRRHRLLDPAQSQWVDTEFGARSVWTAADYRAPQWLTEPAVGGRRHRVTLPSALRDPLDVDVWVPRGLRARDAARMMWCFDGSSYAGTGQLLQWAGAGIAAGRLPACRIVLVDARRRMQWFSGSERFLRSVDLGIAALHDRYAVAGPLAMLGSSLGGLTAMLVGMRRSDVGVVVSQSGSFFTASSDEGDWPWLPRVRGLVRAIQDQKPIWGQRRDDRELLIGMTCGRHEGNFTANRQLATALRRRGYDATFEAGRDLHNMVAWRDQLDPMLPNLLRRAWSATG